MNTKLPTPDEIVEELSTLRADEYQPTVDIKKHGPDMATVTISHPTLHQIPVWLATAWVEDLRWPPISAYVTVTADGRPAVEVLLYCQPEPEADQ